jgi:hypothetical protein
MTATTTVATIIPTADPGSPQNQFGGARGIAAQINAAVASRTAVADAAYVAMSTDRLIAFTALTAARAVTLCAASSYPTGTRLMIVDESGNCSSSKTITVNAAGGDLIDGAASFAINAAYGGLEIESNGAGAWTILSPRPNVQATLLGLGTAPDPNNVFSASGASALFNGTNFNVTVNKATAGNTASLIFEDGFSGRAQIGLCSDDNFHFKVSPDGSTWLDALDINAATGQLSFNYGVAAGAPAGFRNRIVNGAMAIDQRNAGAAQTFTAGAALAYTVDRFYAYCTGANVTGQRVAGSAPDQYLYQFTGAASVTAIGFGQRIEAANSFDLAGKTATLSVKLANALLTTVNWAAYYATTADTFGSLASPTKTLIASGSFAVNSTLATYSAQIAIPAAATTGVEIVLSVGAQTSGPWTIGEVQLELGQVATPFERRPIGIEIILCQRYYQQIGSNTAYEFFSIGIGASTTIAYFGIRLQSTMRVAPTVNFSAYTTFIGAGSISSITGIFADSAGPSLLFFHITGTGMVTASGVMLQAGGSGGAYIFMSAEL